MKKIFAFVLTVALLLTGCAGDAPEATTVSTTEAPAAVEPEPGPVVIVTDEVKAQMDAVLEKRKFEGIVYLTHNGEVVYQSVSGTNDLGQPLTIDSPMYICSISKQFCATAILILRDQGELSLDDTLEKYFPEYTIGKDITLKNLLTMRSGIVRDYTAVLDDPELFADCTAEEINAGMMEWIFAQPLCFEPDEKMEYSNLNYILLSYVVEQVSGQRYEDFVRQNIFEPLGMTHSGFTSELDAHPEWGLNGDGILEGCTLGDQMQGCGDIVTTAGDIDIWMTALPSGKVICQESYQEMATDYSSGSGYGYGLMLGLRNGWGHGGTNGAYTSYMYFNEEYGYNLYIVTGNTPLYIPDITTKISTELLRILYTATDAANK